MSSTNSNCSALLSAVKKVDYAQTQKLLSEHGLSINDKWNDYKILIHAVHTGNAKIVKLLLSYGCRVRSSRTNSCKTPLCYAVKQWDSNMVRILLEAGASITDKDINKDTPLYMAMKSQFVTAVDLMLSKYDVKNADVTSADEIIHFYIACIRNNVDLVKSFIRYGMNVNTYVSYDAEMWPGYSPLHFAVKNQCVEVLELLLSYGASYTFLNAEKLSPLHMAYYLESSVKKYVMMDYIIHLHGTNAATNPVDPKGLSHFHIACMRTNKETVMNFLKKGIVINSPTSEGWYPLHSAVAFGREEIVEILLKYGASVNVKVRNLTALDYAISDKMSGIAKLLLAYGANVCAKDDNNSTPIHHAYYNLLNSHEIFSSMMSVHQGKMINVTDRYGLSIFHIACAVGDTTAVENFLQRNIDVNVCLGADSGNYSGFTGFHFAAMNFHEDVIELLLKHKVNASTEDKNGRSAIWLAVQFVISKTMVHKLNENLLKYKTSYEEANVSEEEVMDFMYKEVRKIPIVKILAEHWSDLNRLNKKGIPLLYQAYNPDVIWTVNDDVPNRNFIQSICKKYNSACRKEIFGILIKNGIGLYVRDTAYNSILHLMAADPESDGNLEIAKMLLMNGCNPNFINTEKKTALHIAARNGSVEYVKLFLKYKANLNCKDMFLSTPLHYAAQKSFIKDSSVESLHAKIMQLLIHNGADLEARDERGCTPLFAAVHRGQAVKALLCLLKANCQVNICNNEGTSPLLLAARELNYCAVKLLLDYGADINLTCENKCGLLRKIISVFDAENFFDYCFMETFKVLEMHIEKLRLINHLVSPSDLIYRKHLGMMLANRIFIDALEIFTEKEEAKFDQNEYDLPEEDNFITPVLQGELEKMKGIKIQGRTSLYDILLKNEIQMVKYVKNAAFVEYLEKETLNVEFQHYGYLLKLKYRQGMERCALLKPTKESLRQLIGYDLPDLCSDCIFLFLSNADLKNLSDAYI